MHHSPYVAGGDVICDAVVIFCCTEELSTNYVCAFFGVNDIIQLNIPVRKVER
jgi:hypothetical protein